MILSTMLTSTIYPFLPLIRLLAISGWITQSSCFTSTHNNKKRSVLDRTCFNDVHTINLKHKYGSSLCQVSATASNSCEEEDQGGMKDAFELLDALSPEDVSPPWKNKPKTPLKYSRADDTQLFYYGKSTDYEIEHYLDMQEELENDASVVEKEKALTSCIIDENNVLLSELLDQKDDNFISSQESQHPWNSINPILRLRGRVATGYGRGGKTLGVPTANLPSSLFQSALENIDTGVYFGWAVIEGDTSDSSKVRCKAIKAVVNVGYSPTFEGKENKEKIVEAHLITKTSPMTKYEGNTDTNENNTTEEIEIEKDFYGETMRLQLIGFLRPEQKFDSFPDLVAQINRDIGHAAAALDSFPYVFSKEDEFICNCNANIWVGSSGGDDKASWEYETW